MAAPVVEGACCSLQRSLVAAPEHRRWRRVHGLQPPLHPQQILGWVLLGVLGGSAFLLVVPALSPSLWPLFFSLLAGLFVLHAAAHLAALLLDPADPELRRLGPSTAAVPEFDRTKHAHVIENGRCHLCNIGTSGPRTKHCSVCNKCVGRFDHHCKWLNHCVGGRNYAAFLVCVVSAALACLLVVLLSAAVLVFFHVDRTWLAIWYYSPFDGTEYDPQSFNMFALDPRVFLVTVGAVGVLAAIAAGLLLHLCIFHVYISYKGITTYEYIRNYRENASVKNRATSTVHPKSANPTRPIFTVERNGSIPPPARRPRGWPALRWIGRLFRRPQRRSLDLGGGELRPRSKESFSVSKSSLDTEKSSYAKLGTMKRTATFPADSVASRTGPKELIVRKSCPGCRYCQMLKADPTLKEQIDAYKRKSARRKMRKRVRGEWSLCGGPEEAVPAAPSPVRRNRVGPGGGLAPRGASTSLPALPPPARRQVVTSVSLKELDEVLSAVQAGGRRIHHHRRRTASRPPKKKANPLSPTLSPIHESGLSNPPTPRMVAAHRPPPTPHSWVPPGSSPLVR